MFNDDGSFIPVKYYECIIHTGTAIPISVTNINYEPQETPIMIKSISSSSKFGQIEQIYGGQWLFKALIARNPHREHILDIANFVWKLCVNYIALNAVTKVIPYPIPRCYAVLSLDFGDYQWFWLMDSPSGYHQIRVALESKEKSPSLVLMLQNGLIMWCQSAQLIERRSLSNSFMTWIARGNDWPRNIY